MCILSDFGYSGMSFQLLMPIYNFICWKEGTVVFKQPLLEEKKDKTERWDGRCRPDGGKHLPKIRLKMHSLGELSWPSVSYLHIKENGVPSCLRI